jgi:hypothetical protein
MANLNRKGAIMSKNLQQNYQSSGIRELSSGKQKQDSEQIYSPKELLLKTNGTKAEKRKSSSQNSDIFNVTSTAKVIT